MQGNKVVTIIPQKKKAKIDPVGQVIRKRRVAGYARVSTEQEQQQNSYQTQLSYYTEYISSRPDWEFAGMYSDEGITGTSTKRRDGFNRMVEDALAGKIDLIVTQKLSNATSDPQEIAFVARILAAQDPPIGIYFISEDIFTLASYYWIDMKDKGILPDGWKVLPPDELDGPMPDAAIMLEDTGGKEPEKVSITRDTGDMNADGEVV